MMITITTIAANESVNAGKRVVEIDGETLGVFATVLDAFDAVDAWARAALGFGVKAWDDYYTVPAGRPGMSETLAVYLHSLADVAYELDVAVSELDTAHLASGVAHVSASHVIEMANSLLNRQVAHSLEVSAAYRVATAVLSPDHVHSETEIKRAARTLQRLASDPSEGEHARREILDAVRTLHDALPSRPAIMRFYDPQSDGDRGRLADRVGTLVCTPGRGATIVASETGLLVNLLGDAPVKAVRTLMGIMPDLVAYVWSDCDRVEVAYVPTTGMFTTVSVSFKS